MSGLFGVASQGDCVSDLVAAIGLPDEQLCSSRWPGRDQGGRVTGVEASS
jgi:hypothetical protein